MKSILKTVVDHGVEYKALVFVCPGCLLFRGAGLHMLPVSPIDFKPFWSWNNDLDFPTLSPSILSKIGTDVCHSFLTNGVFEFLTDCTHSLSGQKVVIPDLPDWITNDNLPE